MPPSVAPPSSTIASSEPSAVRSQPPPSLAADSPLRFALVAVSGWPSATASPRATAWPGTRTATLARPPSNRPDSVGCAGSTNVSGPGQKISARRRPIDDKRPTYASTCSRQPSHKGDAVRRRPAFRLKQVLECCRLPGVGTQPVQRLGWVRKESSRNQLTHRGLDRRRFRVDRIDGVTDGTTMGHSAASVRAVVYEMGSTRLR